MDPFDVNIDGEFFISLSMPGDGAAIAAAASAGKAISLRCAPLLPCARLSLSGPKVGELDPVVVSTELSRQFTPGQVVEVHIVGERVYCPTLVVPADRLRALRYCLRRVFCDKTIETDYAGAHEWIDMPLEGYDCPFERLMPQPDKRQLAAFFELRYARLSHTLADPLLDPAPQHTVYYHGGNSSDPVVADIFFEYTSRYGGLTQRHVDWMPVVRRRFVGRLEVDTLTYTPFDDPEGDPHWANTTFGVPFKLTQKTLWRALHGNEDKVDPRNDYRVDVRLVEGERGVYTVRLPTPGEDQKVLRLEYKPRDQFDVDRYVLEEHGAVFLKHGFSRSFPASRPRVVSSVDQLPFACAAASSSFIYHEWDKRTNHLHLEPVCDMRDYNHEAAVRSYYCARHPLHFESFPLESPDHKHYPRWPEVPAEFADYDYCAGKPLVVVYTAPPGSGKTSLALQHADHVMRRQPVPFRPRVAVVATPRITLTVQIASQLRQTHNGVWKVVHYKEDELELDESLPTVIVTTPYSLGKAQAMLDQRGVNIDVLLCDEFVATAVDLMYTMQDGRRVHVMNCLSRALAASALTIIMDATPHLFAHGPYLGFICSAVTGPVTVRYAPLEIDESEREEMLVTVLPHFNAQEKRLYDAIRDGKRVAAFFGSVRHLTVVAHALEACGVKVFCISNGRCDHVDDGLTLAQHIVKHGIQAVLYTSKGSHGLNIDVPGLIDDSFTFAQRGVGAEVISQSMHRVRQCLRRYIAFKKSGARRFERHDGACMDIMENLETNNHTRLVRRAGCVDIAFPLYGLQSAWLSAARRSDDQFCVSTIYAAMHRHGITRIVREPPPDADAVDPLAHDDEQERLSCAIVQEVMASIHMAGSESSRARLSSLLFLTPLELHSPSLHSFVTARYEQDDFIRFGLVVHFLHHAPADETDIHRAVERIVDSSAPGFEREYVLLRANLLTVGRRACDAAAILRAMGIREFDGAECRARVRGSVPAGYARASGFSRDSPAVSLQDFLKRCWSRSSCNPVSNFLRAQVGLDMFRSASAGRGGGRKIVVTYSDPNTPLFMHLFTRWTRRHPDLVSSDAARHWVPPMPDPWPLAAELDIAAYGDVPACWPSDERCAEFCQLDLPGDSSRIARAKAKLAKLNDEPLVTPDRLTPHHPRYARVFGNFLPAHKFAALAELSNTGLPRFAEIVTLFPERVEWCMEGISREQRRELDVLAGL